MEDYINKLKEVEIQPDKSSWLKLELRLNERMMEAQPEKSTKLYYKLLGSAAAILILVGSFYIGTRENSLSPSQGFTMVEMDNNTSENIGIYDITALTRLSSAYHQKTF